MSPCVLVFHAALRGAADDTAIPLRAAAFDDRHVERSLGQSFAPTVFKRYDAMIQHRKAMTLDAGASCRPRGRRRAGNLTDAAVDIGSVRLRPTPHPKSPASVLVINRPGKVGDTAGSTHKTTKTRIDSPYACNLYCTGRCQSVELLAINIRGAPVMKKNLKDAISISSLIAGAVGAGTLLYGFATKDFGSAVPSVLVSFGTAMGVAGYYDRQMSHLQR